MAFTYRLSRRLAQAHVLVLAGVFTVGCSDQGGFLSPSDPRLGGGGAGQEDGRVENFGDPGINGLSALTPFALTTVNATGCTNEPAGYTTFTNQPWNAIPPLPPVLDPYGWRNSTSVQSRLTIRTDAGAPGSPSKIMEGKFAKGVRGGTGPFNLELKFGRNVTRVYQCMWHKLSSNFTNNKNANVKFGFLLSPYWSGSSSINHYFNLTPELGVHLQSSNLKLNRQMKSTWKTMNYGDEWHKFEFLFLANTKGKQDGVARIWVDGNQVLNVADVQYFHAGQTPKFIGLTWNPTYGGGTNPVPFDMFQWVDNWYVSGS